MCDGAQYEVLCVCFVISATVLMIFEGTLWICMRTVMSHLVNRDETGDVKGVQKVVSLTGLID